MISEKPQQELPTWSVPVALSDIPETGRRYELSADAVVREAIARGARLRSLPELVAVFDVTRYGPEGLRVTGQVSARVGQDCVVTLEPMESRIEEMVDLVFDPRAAESVPGPQAKRGVDIGSEAGDPPELLRGGAVDLGAIAVEFLNLGIDPYPRKPGAVFETPATSGDASSHPFAGLAALKRNDGGKVS